MYGANVRKQCEPSRGAPNPPLFPYQGLPPLDPAFIGLRPRPQAPDGLEAGRGPGGREGPGETQAVTGTSASASRPATRSRHAASVTGSVGRVTSEPTTYTTSDASSP